MIIWPEKIAHISWCCYDIDEPCSCGADKANAMLESCQQAVAKAGETKLGPIDKMPGYSLAEWVCKHDLNELEHQIICHLENGTHIPKEDVVPATRLIMISVRQEICAKFGQQEKQGIDSIALHALAYTCWNDDEFNIAQFIERICERFSAPSHLVVSEDEIRHALIVSGSNSSIETILDNQVKAIHSLLERQP